MSIEPRRIVAFSAWFVLAAAAAVSMGAYHYPPWAILALGGFWVVAIVAAVWAAPAHRTLSLIIALASSVAMRATFLQMLWAIESVRGHIA